VIAPGTIVKAPLQMADLYPTLVALAGGSPNQPLSLDGKSIWSCITEGKPSPHEEILIDSVPSGGSFRVGDWKLIVDGGSTELFDLAADPGETTNLASRSPAKVKELRDRFDALTKDAVTPFNDGGDGVPAGFVVPRVWGEAPSAGQ
jgi:arylsulfatase A-like enzyme